jgi:WD40 repeat protein
VRTNQLQKDVYQILWSRDGKQLAFVEFNKQVEIRMPPADQPVRILGEGKRVVGFDFSPEGNIVAIGENSQNATIIDLTESKEIELQTGQSQPSVKFSPDGKTLATGGYGTKAKLWSTTTGELVGEFDVGPEEGGLTPVFSPDGKVLVVGHRNHMTRLFDVASGRLLHTLPKKMSQGLRFDPTGTTLAVVYVDGSLSLWDVQTGTLKHNVKSRADELYTVDWTPDGSVLVTAGNNSQVTLWNPADLSILSELETPEWVISIRFSPDGTKLLFAGGGRLPQVERFVETWAIP